MKSAWQKTRLAGVDCLIPFDNESENKLKNFIINEPLAGDISGARNPRSLKQLGLYWKACSVVAENTGDQTMNTADKVDWQLRNHLKFFDTGFTYVDGEKVAFKVRSISFKNLAHAEACDYFNEAFRVMADFLGVDTETFVAEVKSRFGGRCA